MKKRKRQIQDDHENHERWLVSYADLMTLLFAFFVVMYAISSINEHKFKEVSSSVAGALNGYQSKPSTILSTAPNIILKEQARLIKNETFLSEEIKKSRKHMTTLAKNIMDVLSPLVREGKVRVTQTSKGVTVEINASVLFGPGDATLSDTSVLALRAVGNVLRNDDHHIIVEGHTDIIPISNLLFASNWELSAVRASRVVRLFSEQGVADSRLVASGRGATTPVADNETAEGRARNRRVTILILSDNPNT